MGGCFQGQTYHQFFTYFTDLPFYLLSVCCHPVWQWCLIVFSFFVCASFFSSLTLWSHVYWRREDTSLSVGLLYLKVTCHYGENSSLDPAITAPQPGRHCSPYSVLALPTLKMTLRCPASSQGHVGYLCSLWSMLAVSTLQQQENKSSAAIVRCHQHTKYFYLKPVRYSVLTLSSSWSKQGVYNMSSCPAPDLLCPHTQSYSKAALFRKTPHVPPSSGETGT